MSLLEPPEGPGPSKCPKCGDLLPAVLFSMHVDVCDGEGVVVTEPDVPETPVRIESSGDPLHDQFMSIVADLDFDERTMVDVNVTLLDDVELSRRYNAVREELLQRGEMMDPTTETGRELHSQRAAYIIELRKRGLT